MKITAIKQQVKQTGRYSIFVDDAYAFSLSENALLSSGLASGQELTKQQVADYKKLSAEDKLYERALKYVAIRPRSRWEIQFYLERKDAPPLLVEKILNKLSNIDLIDDARLARAYVADRQLLRPASRRKIISELRKKHVADEIIQSVTAEQHNDQAALQAIIESKRRQSKYRDNDKLMQYLARQGFSYGDIKTALQEPNQD